MIIVINRRSMKRQSKNGKNFPNGFQSKSKFHITKKPHGSGGASRSLRRALYLSAVFETLLVFVLMNK